MSAKEYPENVAGQVSVYRLNANELTVEFTYSREFKAEYLKCLEIGQDVRAPVYTRPPKANGCNVCGEVYQVIGALWNDEQQLIPTLDNLSASASGKPIPHETLLPFVPKAVDAELVRRIDAEMDEMYTFDKNLLTDLRKRLTGEK
jgi:hypothetical protein